MTRRHVPYLLVLLVLGLLFTLGWDRSTQAEPSPENHSVFLHVSGDGPSTKAWYSGAPPSGVPIQDALDHFSELGYHVAEIAAADRPAVTIVTATGQLSDYSAPDQTYMIVLER